MTIIQIIFCFQKTHTHNSSNLLVCLCKCGAYSLEKFHRQISMPRISPRRHRHRSGVAHGASSAPAAAPVAASRPGYFPPWSQSVQYEETLFWDTDWENHYVKIWSAIDTPPLKGTFESMFFFFIPFRWDSCDRSLEGRMKTPKIHIFHLHKLRKLQPSWKWM